MTKAERAEQLSRIGFQQLIRLVIELQDELAGLAKGEG